MLPLTISTSSAAVSADRRPGLALPLEAAWPQRAPERGDDAESVTSRGA